MCGCLEVQSRVGGLGERAEGRRQRPWYARRVVQWLVLLFACCVRLSLKVMYRACTMELMCNQCPCAFTYCQLFNNFEWPLSNIHASSLVAPLTYLRRS